MNLATRQQKSLRHAPEAPEIGSWSYLTRLTSHRQLLPHSTPEAGDFPPVARSIAS